MALKLRTLRARVRARRHTVFLVAIIVAFVVRPLFGDSGAAPIVFSLAMASMLLVGLLTIQIDDLVGERDRLVAQRRRMVIVGWALAIPAIADRVLILFDTSTAVLVVGAIVWLLFFIFATWSQLRSVLKQREVTGETISNAVSVYLLMGMTWGIAYVVIFLVQPQAFNWGGAAPPPVRDVFPILIYFSMTTLSTVGFGDITPVTLQARYVAVAEGITGQFYLAILVARLVSLHMAGSASRR